VVNVIADDVRALQQRRQDFLSVSVGGLN